MAVDRKQVEAVAFDAYMFPNGTNWMMSAEVLAELCRTWLALDAAPEGEVVVLSDGTPTIKADDLYGLGSLFGLDGYTVRLVATPASGGPRE